MASGFTGIGIAIQSATAEVADELLEQLAQCCSLLLSSDVDEKITFGTVVALEVRELAEKDVESARQVEQMVGLCGDNTVARSYEIARGEDGLGQLIAQESDSSLGATGLIIPTAIGGGGLPSTN
jgi:hypothetical protein